MGGWVGVQRWLRMASVSSSCQAVIQNPFSNGGSPAAEAVSGEARFAYFPASSVGDTTAVSVQTTDQSLQAGGNRRGRQGTQQASQAGKPTASSNCAPSFGTDPCSACRPVLRHDDAPGCASDRNAEDDRTPDTPLLPVRAGDLLSGSGDTGRACTEDVQGLQEGEVFWKQSQAVEHTAGSRCIFSSVSACLVLIVSSFLFFCIWIYLTKIIFRSDSLGNVWADETQDNTCSFFPTSRKIDGTRTPRDERRRAQHNEGKVKAELLGPQAQPGLGLGVTDHQACCRP